MGLTGGPILYDELASWWPLLSAPEEYAEEAALYLRLFRERSTSEPRSLLELGSGGGNNASHLKRAFASVTLVDRSQGMLRVSQALNPECEHLQGDMYTVRLGRTFDCVFLHDAVCYAATTEALRAVLETAFVHCAPGGVCVVAPDFLRETFQEGAANGGHDGDGRALRYLEWRWDPDPSDTAYVVDYAYLLRDGDETSVRQDRHIEGLFSREVWSRLLEGLGFKSFLVTHRFPEVDYESSIFVAQRPGADSG